MSILPANDLIIDVGHAALPSRKAEALHRLERLSVSGEGATSRDTATPVREFKEVNTFPRISTSSLSAPVSTAPADISDTHRVFRKFEAFILQTWLELLLPKVDGGAYGNDQAGGLWRSLMAEQLGDQLAKNGALGLAPLTEHSVRLANKEPDQGQFGLIEKLNPAQIPSDNKPWSRSS